MSPKFRLRNKSSRTSFEVFDELVKGGSLNDRPLGTSSLCGPGVLGDDLGHERADLARVVSFAPFASAPALHQAPFGERRDPRVEELVRLEAQEVGDVVQICQLDFPLAP